MSHPFLEKLAGELASAGVATFRYQFSVYGGAAARARPPTGSDPQRFAAAVGAAAEAAPGTLHCLLEENPLVAE